ncbi:MAG: hypothetical protein DRN99_07110 [Thermoproteota archaeon]|nr:MAG: hypothetical protein DRN99_07110 [Candidatus Korarchaeota archaeon]
MDERIKVTLLLRSDLVKKVESKLASEGKSLSELVEDLLEAYDSEKLLDELCEELGLEKRPYSDMEVTSSRPRGLKAEDIVRELRDQRYTRLWQHL